MVGLLDGSIDAAEAMTYNEYAQVLEAVNPDTGELYTPEDLNVISYEDDRRRHAAGRDLGRRRPARGRPGVRRHRHPLRRRVDRGLGVLPRQPGGVPRHRRRAGSQLGQPPAVADERDQQADLAAPEGIGCINEDAWNRTVEIALNTPNLEGATVLTAEPTEGAYTNDIVTAAYALLGDRRHQRRRLRADPEEEVTARRGRRLTHHSPMGEPDVMTSRTLARHSLITGGGGRRCAGGAGDEAAAWFGGDGARSAAGSWL